MIWRRRTRRIALALAAIVFLGIAAASLIAPAKMAEPMGYALTNINAYSEFRAIYVGLWLAHAIVLGWAAWRIDQPALGDVGGILILGQVIGRVLSLVLDGIPGADLAPFAIAELAGGAVILSVRPKPPDA